MRIALLVPSRERIDKKLELINSIKNTVADINNITLYFGIDTDDPTRDAVLQIAKENTFIKIVDIESVGHFQNLGILWNICAKAANEEILSMIGDDMIFLSKNWDLEIINEFSPEVCPKDNFKMVFCNDCRHGNKCAVNCFIHRSYYEINGYFAREEFPINGIDIWLHQIYNSFGRLYYRNDILIEHKHWSFRKSRKDTVANRMGANNAGNISNDLWIKLLPERILEAERISRKTGLMFYKNFINESRVMMTNLRDIV